MNTYFTPQASGANSTQDEQMTQSADNSGIHHPPIGAAPADSRNEIDDNSKYLEYYRKNLIVNYLPQYYTEKHLYEIFIPFGPIHSVKIMRDSRNGYSYGFGFVNYMMDENAEAAKVGLNGQSIGNKRLKVSFARPSCEEIKDSNCYVRNLPTTITEDQLDEMFGKFGIIVQKKLLRDTTGLPRGTAFVRYANRSQAASAISSMNHFILPGSDFPLRVNLAHDYALKKSAFIAGFQDALISYPSYSPFCG